MSNIQTFDSQVSREEIESRFVECGYWGSEELRRRHACVLSPSVYQLAPVQERDLERLAVRTYAAVKRLNDELIDLATGGKHLTKSEAQFLRLANNGSRSLLRPLDEERRIPPVIKVDLIQNSAGDYFIAEVDVYNPRGFGYAALLEESFASRLWPFRYPGLAGLIELFDAAKGADEIEWHVVISEFERYYETPFRVLAQSFKKRDRRLHLVREEDLALGRTSLAGALPGILAIPESLNKHPRLRDELLSAYREKKLRALYPPVAYLGSKAFLPYLRSCEGMEEFIPSTVLIGKGYENKLPSPEKAAVLKAAVSSGMKGVFFSDLDREFGEALESACDQKNSSWILQEQVPQEPMPVTVFESDGTRVVQDYYLRITAYITERGVLDAQITGRPDRKVHGAPDCIQLPVTICGDFW